MTSAGPRPISLLEEAVALLREAPAATWLIYLIGSVPFLFVALHFVFSMTHNATAPALVVPESLLLALLYLVRECATSLFADRLLAQTAGQPPRLVTRASLARLAVLHITVGPTALWLLPLSLLTVVPFAWVYLFYQSVTALAGAHDGGWATLAAARQEATRWPRQTWVVLATLGLLGFMLFLNGLLLLVFLPLLLKMLLGWETVFSRNLGTLLNLPFLCVVASLTWLALDPLVKAWAVLHCFYGRAVSSGEDLRATLRMLRPAAALLTLCFFAVPIPRALARELKPAVQAAPLDRTIQQVLQEPDFQWRLPRPPQPAAGRNWFLAATERLLDAIQNGLLAVRDAIGRALRWLLDRLSNRDTSPYRPHAGAPRTALRTGLTGLGLLLALAGAYVWWRTRRPSPVVAATAAPRRLEVDVAAADVRADQLPEQEWLQLADELTAQGNLRLALRALFLALLAHLAARELITLNTGKTDYDYERELTRRARAWPEVPPAFARNRRRFEQSWYGRQPVVPDLLQEFRQDGEVVRHHA